MTTVRVGSHSRCSSETLLLSKVKKLGNPGVATWSCQTRQRGASQQAIGADGQTHAVILLDLRPTTFLDLVPVPTDHREGVFLPSERGDPQAEDESVTQNGPVRTVSKPVAKSR